jgi:hypothetical protein
LNSKGHLTKIVAATFGPVNMSRSATKLMDLSDVLKIGGVIAP